MNVAPSEIVVAPTEVPALIPPSPVTPFMTTVPGDPVGGSWYGNPENLLISLQRYLSIFSEGGLPVVPHIGKANGSPLDVKATLDLPCYAGFPADEKAKWLAHL
jgi:hypothetical protein